MSNHLDAVRDNDLIRKRLAKLMALQCFRNTKLEDYHAGVFPASDTGDYSDVRVVSPYGEIPWQRLSRINDDEMRELMINVVDRCYAFLTRLLAALDDERIVEQLRTGDPLPRWNDPAEAQARTIGQ